MYAKFLDNTEPTAIIRFQNCLIEIDNTASVDAYQIFGKGNG